MSASLDLARRAVACKGWRWMPGMLGHAQPAGRFSCRVDDTRQDVRTLKGAKALPDLDDPATLGCLLALVREAWGDQGLCVQHRGGISTHVPAWLIETETTPPHPGHGHWLGHTEAEALVAALEAAP